MKMLFTTEGGAALVVSFDEKDKSDDAEVKFTIGSATPCVFRLNVMDALALREFLGRLEP